MSRSASFDITSIFRSTHVGVAGQSRVIRLLRRAGAEQEGDEEEGHYWTSNSQCVDCRIAEGVALGVEEEFEQ